MDTGSLIVITIFFLPLLLLIISHFRTKSLKKKYDASLKQSESLTQAVDELLSKYGSIIDIEYTTKESLMKPKKKFLLNGI